MVKSDFIEASNMPIKLQSCCLGIDWKILKSVTKLGTQMGLVRVLSLEYSKCFFKNCSSH